MSFFTAVGYVTCGVICLLVVGYVVAFISDFYHKLTNYYKVQEVQATLDDVRKTNLRLKDEAQEWKMKYLDVFNKSREGK